MSKIMELNRFHTESMLKYKKGFGEITQAIVTSNTKRFKEFMDVVDFSLSENRILRIASAYPSKEIFELALSKSKDVDRATIICNILSGGNISYLESFGDLTSDDLSGEALVICSQKSNLIDFLKSSYDNASDEDIYRHDLFVIACKSDNIEAVEFLLEKGYKFCMNNALIACASVNATGPLSVILDRFSDVISIEDYYQCTLSASISSNHEVVSMISNYFKANLVFNFSDVISIDENAIAKAACSSESIEILDILADNGLDFSFDNSVLLYIAALSGKDILEETKERGNVSLFEYIANKIDWNFDYKTIYNYAKSFNKHDTKKFIRSNKNKFKVKLTEA